VKNDVLMKENGSVEVQHAVVFDPAKQETDDAGVTHQKVAISLEQLNEADAKAFVGWEMQGADQAEKSFMWTEDGTPSLLDDANIFCQRKTSNVTVLFVADGKAFDGKDAEGNAKVSYLAKDVPYGRDTITIAEDALQVHGYTASGNVSTLTWDTETDGRLLKASDIAFTPWMGRLEIIGFDSATTENIHYETTDEIKYSEYPEGVLYPVTVNPEKYYSISPDAVMNVALKWQDGTLVNEPVRLPYTSWTAKVNLVFTLEDGKEVPVPLDAVCKSGVYGINVLELLKKQAFEKPFVLEDEGMSSVELRFLAEGKLDTTGQEAVLTANDQGGYDLRVKLVELQYVDVSLQLYHEGELLPVTDKITVLAESTELPEGCLNELSVLEGIVPVEGLTIAWKTRWEAEPLVLDCKLSPDYQEWKQGDQGAAIAIIQKRLLALGYYGSAEAPITGVYDDAMAKALHLFCLVNMRDAVPANDPDNSIGLSVLTQGMQELLFDEAADVKLIAGVILLPDVRIGQQLDGLDSIAKDAVATALMGDGAGMYAPQWSEDAQKWVLTANGPTVEKVGQDSLEGKLHFQKVEPWQDCLLLLANAEANYIVYLTHQTDGVVYLSKMDSEESGAEIAHYRDMMEKLCGLVSRGGLYLSKIQKAGNLTDYEIALLIYFAKVEGAVSCDCLYPDQVDALKEAAENAPTAPPSETTPGPSNTPAGSGETTPGPSNTPAGSGDTTPGPSNTPAGSGDTTPGPSETPPVPTDSPTPAPQDVTEKTREFFASQSEMIGALQPSLDNTNDQNAHGGPDGDDGEKNDSQETGAGDLQDIEKTNENH